MNLENLDLEKAVLAAMITDVQVFFALTDRLQVEAFTSTLHRALYREVGKMANHDGRVSHKLLTHRLQSEFEDIGPYVGALVSMGKDSDDIAMAQDYAESLVDMHMRRAAQSAIEETRKALAQIDHPPETALIKLTESLADLTNLADFGRMQTLSQAIGTVVDQIGDIASGQASGISWPLAGLHELAGEAMPGDLILLGGAPGAGKRLCVDTPVPTPSGFTTMGAIEVGDEVFSEDGMVTRVAAVSPIELAQASYAVHFSTGEVIFADGDHLWKTMTKKERMQAFKLSPEYRAKRRVKRKSRAVKRSKRPAVSKMLAKRNRERAYDYLSPPTGAIRNTDEIRETLKYGAHLNHSVDVADPLQFSDQDLMIEPYLLGLWLGDGYCGKGVVGKRKADMDVFLENVQRPVAREWDRSENYSMPYSEVRFVDLYQDLQKIGVLRNKHIPINYLRASFEQRLALLQGLMDTDGTSSGDGRHSIGFSNKRLIDDTQHLLSSLGIKARVGACEAQKGSGFYRISFKPEIGVFRLSRKFPGAVSHRRPTIDRRYITAVEPVAPKMMRCIAVEHPSRMYLVGRSCIPTHNTALAMQCATAIAQTRSVAFFEMEMAHSELVKRWYAGAVGVPSNAIKRDMDSKQFNILAENAPGYRDFRMQIWDEKFSVPQMRARSMAQMKRMGLDMIVVDHADLILKESKFRLRGFEKTHDNVEDLKQMAKDLGCVVLVLCHFTKSAREKDTPEPTMEDFSGGGIEKHADIMLATLNRHTWLMTNPPRLKSQTAQDKYQTELLEHEGRIEIHRLKHRRKAMRAVKIFNWDGARTLLTDIVPAQRDLLDDEKPPF